MIFSYFVHVRLPLLRGRIVICDRYVFDAAAEMGYSLLPNDRLNRLAIKLMLALTPKPHIAYLLDIPEEVCAQRKDEDTDVGYSRCQRRAYIELAERYHLRIKRTDGELSALDDEITREVLIPYFDNFETFLNGLFLSNPSQLNKQMK
jgi:thymidylate kinase